MKKQEKQQIVVIVAILVVGLVGYFMLSHNGGGIIPIPTTTTTTIATKCTDTDGGKNYEVLGTARYSPTSWGGARYGSDYCSSASVLVEYYCPSNADVVENVDIVSYTCPNGCVSGVCLQ